MVDIHAHILPELDDGASSMEETLDMLAMAADSGVDRIVATSHGNVGYYSMSEYVDTLYYVRRAVRDEGIPIELVSGMEIYASEDMVELLQEGELLTLNHTKNVLVEFAFDEEPWIMGRYLELLQKGGFRPVVAHPERYFCVQEDPGVAYAWSQGGCILQCNKGSLLGRFGRSVYYTAMSMMEHQLIHVIGSDAHKAYVRTPSMYEIDEMITDMTSTEERDRLLVTNPERILRGEDVIRHKERPYIRR